MKSKSVLPGRKYNPIALSIIVRSTILKVFLVIVSR